MTSPLLEIREVSKKFDYRGTTFGRKGQIVAVDNVSFSVDAAETFSVVGESGSGKSTVGNLVLGLLEPTAGEVLFKGTSLARMSRDERRQYRRAVQAVFQDPYASLNPRMPIGQIVAEPLEVQKVPKGARMSRVASLMEAVGVPPTEMKRYPHELSGGQRQRIGIARALALEPELIVLDEPVSALDVSIRSQILNLLADLQKSLGVAYLLISHDLPSVQHMSHRVGVMYLGRLLEIGAADAVCTDPAHPYTASLISAATPPPIEPPWPVQLIGEIPDTLSVPDGCLFNPRCPFAFDTCRTVIPMLLEIGPHQRAACHLYPDRITEVKHFGGGKVPLPVIEQSPEPEVLKAT